MYKKYQQILRILLIGIGIFICVGNIFIKEARANTVVKVGYVENYGIVTGEDGQKTGYLVDYLDEISKYTGWTYEYIDCIWGEATELLKTGEIDLLGPMQKTVQREEFYDFPKRQLGVEYGALYISENRTDIYYNDPKSLDGKRVATVTDNYQDYPFKEYCEKNDISVELIVTTPNHFEEGLKSGEFDAALTGSTMDVPGSVVAAKISVEPVYIGTTKGNVEVLDNLNMALDRIYMEDAYFDSLLFERYFSNKPISMPAYTQEEIASIKSSPVLRVICNPNWIPLLYYDEQTKETTGIVLHLLQKLCDEIGITMQIISNLSYGEGIDMIEKQEADIMLGYHDYDHSLMQYTDPMLYVPMVWTGNESIDINDHVRVGIHSPSKQVDMEIKKHYPHFEYIEYDSVRDLLIAMQNGVETNAIFNYYAFDELKLRMSHENFHMIITDVSFPINIGVSRTTDSNFTSILNKAMKRLTPEQISSIAFDSTTVRTRQLLWSRLLQEQWRSMIIGLLGVFLLILLILIRIANQKKIALQKIAFYDSLTKIYTAEKFKHEAINLWKNSKQTQYTLICMDINKFKYINDSYGYAIGDQVIIALIHYIKAFKETSFLIGRISADNLVLTVEQKFCTQLLTYIEHIDDAIHAEVSNIPKGYRITYSLGYYHIAEYDEDFSNMLDKANTARKNNKSHYRNNTAEYTAAMDTEVKWKKEVEMCMEQALQNREFVAYFQPKYHVQSEKFVGAETLVRWNHPSYGLLFPGRFIPILEQNDFIEKLDLYMFEEACKYLEEHRSPIHISVNLSRHHLHNDNLAEKLMQIVEKHGLSPNMIELELTESILMDYSEKTLRILNSIRAAGFDLSIDDFGSGYSSLSVLAELPVNIIKIDKGFVDRMITTKSGRNIVAKVNELAKELHMTTVAEGVETKEQVMMLKHMECDIIQGYYFSKPLDLETFTALIEKQEMHCSETEHVN